MLHLDLSPDEQRILEETLENCVSDFHSEIMYTSSYEYKEMLKARRDVLVYVLDEIRHAEGVPPAA